MSKIANRREKTNSLALILHPKVSAVRYFPLKLIKPNDQVHFCEIEIGDCRWWKCSFPCVACLPWCPFWLTDGFLIVGADDGTNDEGNLTGGLGLNGKWTIFLTFDSSLKTKPQCRVHIEYNTRLFSRSISNHFV